MTRARRSGASVGAAPERALPRGRSLLFGARRALRPVARLRPVRALRERATGTIAVGPGRGLRFAPGHSVPAYAVGDIELPVQEALARVLLPGDTFCDVGANVGFLSVVGARLVGDTGRVYAFEPVERNARVLRRNLRLNRLGNVEVLSAAVADRQGRQELVLAASSGGAGLAAAVPPPDAAGSVVVDVVTIDGLVARGDIPPPTLVKIDVEGAELAVLRGMDDSLRRHGPAVLYEIDGPDEADAESRAAPCRGYLEERGYRVDELPRSYSGAWVVRHFLAQRRDDASTSS
jgi:FkbM family methyltransferase